MRALAVTDQFVPRGPFEPPWLIWARGELGVKEVPGPGSDPRVEWYHGATAAGPATDNVAWCSSFLCRAFEEQGLTDHPRSKSSQAWRSWGTGVGPIAGAVCVLSYGGARGHVGLVVGRLLSGLVPLLGGNTSDSVAIRAFPVTHVVGYRWPRAPLIDEPGAARATR